MRKFLVLALIILSACFAVSAAEVPQSNVAGLKLCYELFDVMQLEKQLNDTSEQMLALQMQGNPMLAQFKPELEAFYKKCLQFNNLKEGMAKVYLELFTPEQIKEYIKFYKSPAGRAFAEKASQLTAKTAALSQEIVIKNMPELQKAIQEKAAKLQLQGKPAAK